MPHSTQKLIEGKSATSEQVLRVLRVLRNIGFKDLAILDIHILSLMKEMSLIPKNFKLTIKNYEKTEDILRKLSHQINIDLPELDLTLWFMKTNKIIK